MGWIERDDVCMFFFLGGMVIFGEPFYGDVVSVWRMMSVRGWRMALEWMRILDCSFVKNVVLFFKEKFGYGNLCVRNMYIFREEVLSSFSTNRIFGWGFQKF